MKVLVTTPYGRDSLQGNTVTAKRVVSILLDSEMDAVVVSECNEVVDADVLIALHARKSAHFIDRFLELNSDGRVIVYLTGTDLYEDVPSGCSICERSMDRADALVVSQDASLASVPVKYRDKAVVVHKSIELPEMDEQEVEEGLFSCVGHLRAVKQSFMPVESIQKIDDRLRLVLLGKEVDEGSGEVAEEWQLEDARFEWLGSVSHVEALGFMQRSVATINTSLSEGGANSVGESIVLGVPVLASRVEGNVGMLGEDYLGYFSVDSVEELASLMQRVLHDIDFLEVLREQVRVRSEYFLRGNEKQGWVNLIEKLI